MLLTCCEPFRTDASTNEGQTELREKHTRLSKTTVSKINVGMGTALKQTMTGLHCLRAFCRLCTPNRFVISPYQVFYNDCSSYILPSNTTGARCDHVLHAEWRFIDGPASTLSYCNIVQALVEADAFWRRSTFGKKCLALRRYSAPCFTGNKNISRSRVRVGIASRQQAGSRENSASHGRN